mmetsp:Transcript_82313/g.133578  ORF Transcript_82313/g.133578 Transcript_82313/m.133578 type:complete len:325 (+) Transcript_82313:48-1022(+)|eukprot:CAMPEP_0179433966 /NCGR_PEP_ID=MMETSP0799-20121207/18279_1 /TAXON_ID=46947 /ORGANISM="Geminigera cryophila, Strain CCMP2564" /LENGTH=324 /DNA_ID=CAMNT_0021212271 /DNA_START=35 /DNA_END=1009 /DNA_ORIENTATION=-
MAVPGLNLGDLGSGTRLKWKDHGEKESLSARPPLSYEDMGYTNVVRNGGAITTRCKRSNGWETPDHIDTNLEAEFRMLRLAPSPVRNFSELPAFAAGKATNQITDPWGSRADMRMSIAAEFGAGTQQKSTESRAYINQLQKRCPFASDRRFLGGEWLFKSSQLHKSEPVADKRYLSVYEKRPLTSSRKPGYSSTRSTRQLVAMIHQHMNERSRNSKTSSRLVDMKHPLRALMKADEGQKGFLTCDELRESLDRNWVVVLNDDELLRVALQFPSAIPSPDGMAGFDYMAFVNQMNKSSQEHPLGGHAGSSWGYQQAPVAFYGKVR